MKKEIVISSIELVPGDEFQLRTKHVSKRNDVPAPLLRSFTPFCELSRSIARIEIIFVPCFTE